MSGAFAGLLSGASERRLIIRAVLLRGVGHARVHYCAASQCMCVQVTGVCRMVT